MQHSPRPRRFRTIHNAESRRCGLTTTSRVMCRNGMAIWAEAYAAQVTRLAKKAGLTRAGAFFTKRNDRARPAAAWDLNTSSVLLAGALATYLPGGRRRKLEERMRAARWRRDMLAADLATGIGRPRLLASRFGLVTLG